jgi:hypothetical protein
MLASAGRIVLAFGLLALGVSAASCSRTGIGVPSASDAGASRDARTLDAPSVATIPLSHARIELLLVIDRSGSMQLPMDDGDETGPTRWEALTTGLDHALAAVDRDVIVGAKLYPDDAPGAFDPPSLCRTSPSLTIPPAPDGGSRLLARMRTGMPPRGGTPTAEAIGVALSALDASPLTRRAIVLVTDGAPNCNPDTGAPPERCMCSTDPDECRGDAGAFLCLDDARTLDAIDRAALLGVPVVVVGIDDPRRPDLADVLDRMAVAGGRPRPEGSLHRFHSARSASELEDALTNIGGDLSACTFAPERGGVLGGPMTVELGGARVPESPTEGWTPSPVATNAVVLHGRYCDEALRRDRLLVARVVLSDVMELMPIAHAPIGP